MPRNSKERTVNDLIKTVMAIIIVIAILGYALINLMEEIVFNTYLIALDDYKYLLASLPFFAMLAILIIVAKRNRLWLD